MNTSISILPGIGAKRQALYAKLGIQTIEDLLRHFPRAYQNRGQVRMLSEVQDGDICSVLVTVASEPRVTPPLKNRLVLLKFRVFDDTASATVVFFGQSYLKDVFHTGMVFRLFGKFRVQMGAISITSPQYEPLYPGQRLPDYTPIYPLTDGLSQKMIASAIRLALAHIESNPPADCLPAAIREKKQFPSLSEAFRMIHQPQSEADITLARSRFVFESLYLFSLGIAGMRETGSHAAPPALTPVDLAPFLAALPFPLTPDQSRCLSDILHDMRPDAQRPMARLISGDVGSGKTVLAAAALYLCAKGGKQGMLMAPTEILATQHYHELSPLFASFGISCALLTGSCTESEKRSIRASLSAGTLPIVIGTHALLSEGVHPARPGLVVTDEQHRFGVMQRARLAEGGGEDPHVLVMSATPIPRTLALILYGDLDVSTIETMPPGRQKVDTFVVDEGYRPRLNQFIRKLTSEGGQIYVVCPAIEPPPDEEEEYRVGSFLSFESGTESTADNADPPTYATIHACELQEIFPDLTVRCLHGRMKPAEKDAIMSSFAAGEIQILVSTTVIEVGVNVPNACLMLIENAERFGLSQLHQLRGRVGRGTRKSYCVLVSHAKADTAKKRLEVLRQTANGYAIAQEDLRLRGPGDFFPTSDGAARQSGSFSIGLASLCTDLDELKEAADFAEAVLRADPTLCEPENQPARDRTAEIFRSSRHSIS